MHDHVPDIFRRCPVAVDDEVGMLEGDFGAAELKAFQPALLYKPLAGVPGIFFKNRPAVRKVERMLRLTSRSLII